MLKANNEQLEIINKRYNDVQDDINVGIDYCGEGIEITEFEVDDNGRVSMEVEIWHLNNQWAMRCRHQTRHPRLTKNEIDYLLGQTNELQ